MTATEVAAALRALATPEKAKASAWFFKTGPGQYGEGDQFIGVTVPEQRQVAKRFQGLPLTEVEKLIQSPIHEERLTGLIILVGQFAKGDDALREQIYNFYLAHTANVNNWDLVDSSAEQIVGGYLNDKDRYILERLARSDSLWERRIAIIATFHYIKQGQSEWTFRIADLLMNDKHDLIHKAVGWMLREVGKKCGHDVLEAYLKDRYLRMPRTMLRYSIEHFDPAKRQRYIHGLF
jgi:3-methyladenine DNA glycosylase AlkD